MDRRKLLSKKNLLPVSQSSEMSDTVISNKQTTNVSMQEKNHSFDDDKLSSIRSSVLKSLNHSPLSSISSINKNKKRSFNEVDNDVSDNDNNFCVSSKLLKTKSSVTKEVKNKMSSGRAFDTSQQENISSLENRISETKKTDKSVALTGRCQNTNLEQQALDDLSCDESTIVKKKQNKITLSRNSQHTGRDGNKNHDSPEKVLSSIHRSTPIKPPAKHISEKKQNAELNSYVESEKYRLNTREHSKSHHTSSVFVNFLQKSGITLADGLHVLSKFFFVHVFYFLNF